MSPRRRLTGWGGTAPTAAEVVAALGTDGLGRAVAQAPERGVLARGLGRSYGDAAQNAGGTVVDMTTMAGIHDFDPATGIVEVDAGVSLDTLMAAVVPQGWFPHVTPGTRQVTVGGAIAADIHGKNHHRDGSFAQGVVSLDLHAPTGTFTLAPGDERFDATAGGMGLTGIVSRARLQLQAIPTSRLLVETHRARDLDAVMGLMATGDANHHFSVAWIDLLARGRDLGRSVLTRGDWAPPEALGLMDSVDPRDFDPGLSIGAPPWLPSGMLNRASVAAFNELWFRKAPRHRVDEVQDIGTFFHPLDAVVDWNRIYGARGFVQYQFVVPFGAEATLRTIIEELVASRRPSFLAVLKRFGPGGDGHLSFPSPGWTLALDLPVARTEDLAGLLRRFDHLVADAGGRVYLAKDSCLDPAVLATMYPRLDAWREVAATLDPDRRMTSDLDRRLGLRG